MKNFEANDAIRITRRSLLAGALATAALTVSSASGAADADPSATGKDGKAEGTARLSRL